MKQIFLFIGVGILIISCGDNNEKATTSSDTQPTATTAKVDPDAEEGLQLVGKSDCFSCHKIKDPFNGPAYEAIAAKYPNNQGVIDSLSQKIIKGGAGNWGTVPMTPHPDISEKDAKQMVKYVLSLKP